MMKEKKPQTQEAVPLPTQKGLSLCTSNLTLAIVKKLMSNSQEKGPYHRKSHIPLQPL